MRPLQSALNKLILKDKMRLHPDVTRSSYKGDNYSRIIIAYKTFEEKARAVHGNKYSYKFSTYKNTNTDIKIYCKKCKEFFYQGVLTHLSGSNHLKCSGWNRRSVDDFINEAKAVHGGKYDYSKTNYVNNSTKVKIGCKKCGEFFHQLPTNHKNNGQGCPRCALYGFNIDKPAILYIFKVEVKGVGKAYKVGITNRTVEERYHKRDLDNITDIETYYFSDGEEAYLCEQKYIKRCKKFKYEGEPLLSSGNTELFKIRPKKLRQVIVEATKQN